MELQSNLDMIINIAKNIVPLNQAFLFGSFAYGTPKQDSDYDLYFVVDKIDGSTHETIVKLSSAIREEIDKPIDILLRTKDDFDFRASNRTTIEHKVLNHGRRLYG